MVTKRPISISCTDLFKTKNVYVFTSLFFLILQSYFSAGLCTSLPSNNRRFGVGWCVRLVFLPSASDAFWTVGFVLIFIMAEQTSEFSSSNKVYEDFNALLGTMLSNSIFCFD